ALALRPFLSPWSRSGTPWARYERSAARSTTTRSRRARETSTRPAAGEGLATDRSGSVAGTSFWGTSVPLRAGRPTAITIGTARWWFGQRGNRSCADRRRRQCRAAGTRRPCSIAPPLTLARLSFPLFSALAAVLASLRATLPLGPRLDHRQRDPLTLLIDAHHPDRHHVAHAHHVVWGLDVAIGKLTDV